MIKKMGISVILMLECSGLALYFYRVSHDSDKIYWNSDTWTMLFHLSIMVPLGLLSLFIGLTSKQERSIFDNSFLLVLGLFNFIIVCAIITEHFHLIAHTYGLQISALGIIIATILIVNAAWKHGYYK